MKNGLFSLIAAAALVAPIGFAGNAEAQVKPARPKVGVIYEGKATSVVGVGSEKSELCNADFEAKYGGKLKIQFDRPWTLVGLPCSYFSGKKADITLKQDLGGRWFVSYDQRSL